MSTTSLICQALFGEIPGSLTMQREAMHMLANRRLPANFLTGGFVLSALALVVGAVIAPPPKADASADAGVALPADPSVALPADPSVALPADAGVAHQSVAALAATDCPEMTDSIRRLYLVVLDREPEANELTTATNRYRLAQANLETLAAELVDSDEFVDRYGELDDDEFVVQLHRTGFGRAPSDGDRSFWVTRLADDAPRASVVLTISESEQVIRSTQTERPLSGYLRWYPAGTHWYCGHGMINELPIVPLSSRTWFADFMFINNGVSEDLTALRTTIDGEPHVRLAVGTVPPGFSAFDWSGAFEGDGNYGNRLDIRASEDTRWVVVLYPSPLGNQRLGWQLL